MEKSNVTNLVPKEKSDKKEILNSLSPREIVSELDRFVVGQENAKRAANGCLRLSMPEISENIFLDGIISIVKDNIDYIPPLETTSHRGIWSFVFLFALILIKKKFNVYFSIFKNKKKLTYLLITSILVSSNWLLFILSISINRVHDAAMGYFISPILSVGFGYIFFKEELSKIHKMIETYKKKYVFEHFSGKVVHCEKNQKIEKVQLSATRLLLIFQQ